LATNLTQRGPNATAPARLPGIQTSRVEDPNTRQALEALREWVEVRLGSRGDFWERALTHREYKLDMDALRLLTDELQRQINALLADRGAGDCPCVSPAEFAAFRAYVMSELAALRKADNTPPTGVVPVVIRQAVGYAAGTSTARNTPPPSSLFDPNTWTPAGDPHWANVIFLNRFNGTDGVAVSGGDESVYGQSFTGFSRYTTTSPIEGTAWVNCTTEYSNPSDQYPTGTEGAIGTGDWTFEIILDADATQGGFALVMGGGNNTGYFFANGYGLILQNSAPPNNLGLWIYNYSAVGPLLKSTTDLRGAGPTAVAVSKNGSTWRLFVNGIVEDTQTWAGSIDGGVNRTRYMRGHGNGGVIDRYLGKYDAVRETVGVGRYTANYAPPWVFGSAPPPLDVLLNLQFDGADLATTTTDASFNAYTVSLLGSFSPARPRCSATARAAEPWWQARPLRRSPRSLVATSSCTSGRPPLQTASWLSRETRAGSRTACQSSAARSC
jgi:hypothetical protein